MQTHIPEFETIMLLDHHILNQKIDMNILKGLANYKQYIKIIITVKD